MLKEKKKEKKNPDRPISTEQTRLGPSPQINQNHGRIEFLN